MLNGITITVVGMITVFIFLGIMVAAMGALRQIVARFLPEKSESSDAVAVAIAASYAAEKRSHTS